MNRVIVSFTTYPARIGGITRVLDSVMEQTYKPDKVVLYLSEEQFVKRKLSVDLSVYFEQGLEVHWCPQDMKSHKKYLYALMEYPDDYVITIDDDFYYEAHMVEELVKGITEFPNCVLSRRAHLITAQRNGNISGYEKWWVECMHYMGEPRMDLCAVGCSGILYPPHIFTKEVFNVNHIKQYCMYADDIWMKVMELISGVPVVRVPSIYLDMFNQEYAKDGLYQSHNGNGGNDRQFHKLLEIYRHFNGVKETLAERIFSTGIVYEDQISNGIKEDNVRMVEEWIGKINREKDIVIYGAGIVARRIYKLLKKNKVEQKIKFFVVEDTDKNDYAIGDINVVQYKNADYTDSVCVIALTDIREQYRVRKQLMEIGLQESRILMLSSQLMCALRDSEE